MTLYVQRQEQKWHRRCQAWGMVEAKWNDSRKLNQRFCVLNLGFGSCKCNPGRRVPEADFTGGFGGSMGRILKTTA
jgi:hypothetical protein